MINDFGGEFVSIKVLIDRRDPGLFSAAEDESAHGLDVGPDFNQMIADALAAQVSSSGPRGRIFYLPPGRYRLPASVRESDAEPPGRIRYELPENVQLYICHGALLRLDPEVELIIRGSFRAGMYQVFGYDRRRSLPSRVAGVNTVPQGHVRFATRLVSAIRPEWWGAEGLDRPGNTAGRGTDNSDALQAAIDAACIHRDDPSSAERFPSIPVLLGGAYRCHRDLTVYGSPETPNPHLILRGSAGLGTQNIGAPTLIRSRPDGDASSEIAREQECALRLGPGVDFDIQDVRFGLGSDDSRVGGCVDILCDDTERAPRRGLLRRCTLIGGTKYALRIISTGGAASRHFVVDASTVAPSNLGYLSERGVEVRGDATVMLHLDGDLMGAAPLKVPRAADGHPLSVPLPSNATIHLTGGSVLARAVQFHNASGPRPSRGNASEVESIDLESPDGQEVFLAAQERSSQASATHFTAVHCECQGWWFLSRPRKGHEQVALVNVVHGNVNWKDDQNVIRYESPAHGPSLAGSSTNGKFPPPSVVWLKGDGQCLLVGCRLDAMFLTDGVAQANIIDVATVFRTAPDAIPDLLGQRFRPAHLAASMIRPPYYGIATIESGQAFDDRILHVVPIAGI